MTAASLYAIKDRYDALAEAECAAGRGKDQLMAFASEVGADFARTSFLQMSRLADSLTADNADEMWEVLNAFPQYAMNELADGVRKGWIDFAGSTVGSELDEVERAAVESFAAALQGLLDSSHGGGEA